MELKSKLTDILAKKSMSLFLDLLSKFGILFVLLISIGLTYLEIVLYLETQLESIIENYHVVIPLALMNFSVMKVLSGFSGRIDPILAVAGTALFIYFGFFNPETQLVLQSIPHNEFVIFNYGMLRICWTVFIVSVHVAKNQSTIIYFVASYGIILLLYKYYKLELLYPVSTTSLIVIPVVSYILSMGVMIGSKIIGGLRLGRIMDKVMKK